MTSPAENPAPRGWVPSAYQAAVALSALSAVLGLGRELLVVRRLRFGEVNDALAFALSITYTVALLGEPLRLGALNLLDRRLGSRLMAVVGAGIVIAASLTTVMYRSGGRPLPLSWMLAAGTAGAANLVLAWVLPRMQRLGPFLPVHAVTVMPNVIIVTGILVPAATPELFAGRVIALFLLCPVLQLAALAALRAFGKEHAPLGPPAPVAEGLRPMRWHALGAAGGQGAQFFLRSSLLLAGTGTLAKFNLVLRVTETIRAVFVDTYIASRIRRWANGEKTSDGIIDGRWLGPAALGSVVVAGLLVALLWPALPGTWPASLELVLGTYLVLALRVRYQSLNTGSQPVHLNRRIAGTEVISAVLAFVFAKVTGSPVALLAWVIYVAKPAAGLGVLSRAAAGSPSALVPEA